MTGYSTKTAHREIALEQHLADRLVASQGYVPRKPEDYDRPLAVDRALVLRFVKDTQPDEWRKLEAQYTTAAETEFFKQLEKALKTRGTLDVLRQGIKLIPGIKFALCFFRPASGLNTALISRYEANILSVIRQLYYSQRSENAIDVALFVNGLPVATAELKNRLTGTTFRHAEKQYRDDRSPAGEPLLTFKRGALVHFAMDEDHVTMTTRLANGKTRFLPFNCGRGGGAGNPDIEGDFRVAYLYADQPEGKAVFSRAVLLDIIGRFVHLERSEIWTAGGSSEVREKLIFPRFQQLDAVRRLMTHARGHGPGQNYLIQHSAGSGKSNTIGWIAHQVTNLHDDADKRIFSSAIIVTDRIVLDRQLQNTVAQFEQTKGLVKKIDGTSRQLKEALEDGARIVITTIQKFSTEHLAALSGQGSRTFAVIIDEAHGSQSGKSAQAMSDALTPDESTTGHDVEDLIAEYQDARGPQPNISYFAFTATPRNVTLERFGAKGADGLPQPFHLYSMRQAIEEGFILDVLQNCMTYKAYYQLEKTIEDDPELNGRRGQRRVARFASLHPTAIGQKVEVVIEHFRRHVMAGLDGNARAMVVTGGREHALRYFFGVRDYIESNGYTDVKALVAFSGELELDGETYTEAALNGFSEKSLPKCFDTGDCRVLIVAEKYQTGFDQPKLCAMYVDRKLAGLQAVQTLSRLNRTYPGKDRTYVLDFQNSIEDIHAAFKPYYEVTSLEANSDPNQIYELEARLKTFGILDQDEIDRFAETFYKGPLDTHDRARLEGLVRHAVARFDAEDDEGRREEFRQLLKSYMRFYSFVAQVIRLSDTGLEKLYTYADWLSRLLPNMFPRLAADTILIGPHHASAELVENAEGRLIARQAKLSLKLNRRDAGRLAGDQISRPKPCAQRHMAAFHDGANRQARIVAALATAQDTGTSGDAEGIACGMAMRTDEAVAPSSFFHVGSTLRFIGKKLLKLWKRPRKGQVVTLKDVHGSLSIIHTKSIPSGCVRQADRQETNAFLSWLDDCHIAPLKEQRPSMFNELVSLCREAVENTLQQDHTAEWHAAVTSGFLFSLPRTLSHALLQESDLMNRSGVSRRSTVRMAEPEPHFDQAELHTVVREALAHVGTVQELSDISGRSWKVSAGRDGSLECVGESETIQFPEFRFLAPEREQRVSSIRALGERVLPRGTIAQWLNCVEEGPLSDAEVARLHKDVRATPSTVERTLDQAVDEGSFNWNEVVPTDRVYISRLVGLPEDSETLQKYVECGLKGWFADLPGTSEEERAKKALTVCGTREISNAVAELLDGQVDAAAILEWVAAQNAPALHVAALEVFLPRYVSDSPLEEPLSHLLQRMLEAQPGDEASAYRFYLDIVIAVSGHLAYSQGLAGTSRFYRTLFSLTQATLIQSRLVPDQIDWVALGQAMRNDKGYAYAMRSLFDLSTTPEWNVKYLSPEIVYQGHLRRVRVAALGIAEALRGSVLGACLLGEGENALSAKLFFPMAYVPGPLEGAPGVRGTQPDELRAAITEQLGGRPVTDTNFTGLINASLAFEVSTEQVKAAKEALDAAKVGLTDVTDERRLWTVLDGLAEIAARSADEALASEVMRLCAHFASGTQGALGYANSLSIGLTASAAFKNDEARFKKFGHLAKVFSFSELNRRESEEILGALTTMHLVEPKMFPFVSKCIAALGAYGMAPTTESEVVEFV